jgi:hypothetical protein
MTAKTDTFVAWPVDSLEKMAPEGEPARRADRVQIEACRNEFVSAQIAVRAARKLHDLRVVSSALTHESGAKIEVRSRLIGYVPIERNTPDTPAEELCCAAPTMAPDPLLEDEAAAVEEGKTQPVWFTIFVPPDAPAGLWRGIIAVRAGDAAAQLPIELTVFPVTIPGERHLRVTNWMNMHNFARFHGTELRTPRFWQVTENYARNMAGHRQNVTWCPLELVRIFQESDGRLSFEYDDLDKWIEVFTRAGCMDLIEAGALGRRGLGKWETPWFEWRQFRVLKRDGSEVKLPPETVVERLVKKLVAHMKRRRWFERLIMHVVDEPAPHTEEDYKRKSALVHQWAPGARFLEAMSCLDMRGYLDIWVPNLDQFDKHMEQYLSLRDESEFELWFYTCMFPTGLYPNRFLDFSLLKTRILHWINWRYKVTGYLHWGLNYWADDPFHQDRIRPDLPPGDCWIVYPGADGPLDSMRWEQMREGLQDYELLWLLGQRDPAKADAICQELVRTPTDYARDFRELRAARRVAVEALIALQ